MYSRSFSTLTPQKVSFPHTLPPTTMNPQAVVEALDGLPAVKLHCSVLAEQAMKAALADYYKRQGVDPALIIGDLGASDVCEI